VSHGIETIDPVTTATANLRVKKKLPVSTCPRGAEDNALRTGSRWTFMTRFDNPVCILRPGQSNNLIRSLCAAGDQAASMPPSFQRARGIPNSRCVSRERGHPCKPLFTRTVVTPVGVRPKCDEGKIGDDGLTGQARFAIFRKLNSRAENTVFWPFQV